MREIDITGRVFGRWTALSKAGTERYNQKWVARCECGAVREVNKSALMAGRTTSCGCRTGNRHDSTQQRHGRYRSRTYNSWERMKQRCFDPNLKRFPDYGGRGITVCERWKTFSNFLEDMGEVPEGHSLERLDVNGNYEPGNCIWADDETQNNNLRGMKKYLLDGKWWSREQLMRRWGVKRAEANRRIALLPKKIVGEQ